MGIERHRIFRADQGEGWLPIAKPDPGIRRIGSFKPGRWNPSRIGHGDWPPGKPVAIVDNDVTIALSLDLCKVRADHAAASLRPWTYSQKRMAILVPRVEHPNQSSYIGRVSVSGSSPATAISSTRQRRISHSSKRGAVVLIQQARTNRFNRLGSPARDSSSEVYREF